MARLGATGLAEAFGGWAMVGSEPAANSSAPEVRAIRIHAVIDPTPETGTRRDTRVPMRRYTSAAERNGKSAGRGPRLPLQIPVLLRGDDRDRGRSRHTASAGGRC